MPLEASANFRISRETVYILRIQIYTTRIIFGAHVNRGPTSLPTFADKFLNLNIPLQKMNRGLLKYVKTVLNPNPSNLKSITKLVSVESIAQFACFYLTRQQLS